MWSMTMYPVPNWDRIIHVYIILYIYILRVVQWIFVPELGYVFKLEQTWKETVFEGGEPVVELSCLS